jgi:vacuolar-type H+-ATPase subunit I/STV1
LSESGSSRFRLHRACDERSWQVTEEELPRSRIEPTSSDSAVVFVLDAVILMLLAGMFQVLVGLLAVFENEIYVQTRNYLFKFDVTTWGWIHLVVGVVVGLAALGLLRGRTWARVVGIILAVLSAIANFLFIPYYPVWSLLIIAVDVFIIWALAVHGREVITG